MVGQTHIASIIQHSIEMNRLHHAYLFSGTRGVGKTTIARILTKCLNCDMGPTATPCQHCYACIQIDKGAYPDLIEIDAASRTKVEDTRELLDNVQYSPTRGRYKVYLIDEVHMLSGHSFNALLKTLEEPPSHVKFLLATTDPEKLPITVLSRCLKLTLKMLTVSEIQSHLEKILEIEKIPADPSALSEIAQAAQGSMRDALSILDQAIVFSGDIITDEKTSQLLGTDGKYLSLDLLTAIADKQEDLVFALTKTMEEKGTDFLRALDELLNILHYLALLQKKPDILAGDTRYDRQKVNALSQKLSPNDIQLLYQVCLTGKRDLPYAPTAKVGMEITLLRAMDFYPLSDEKPKESTRKINTENWPDVIRQLDLKGVTQTIADQSKIGKISDNRLELLLPAHFRSLCNSKQQQMLSDAISQYCGYSVLVTVEFLPLLPAEEKSTKKDTETKQDPKLAQLLNMFDAELDK
ncbi:MAG: DNA polymerase III subunit gamma/tau [Gammaproteobacteria bacterium]|nr:DNA polymerase III subunit gamma/tau [Gammaproteobacteria bacterium]